ncbi:chromosome partitioning protein [Cellulomonas xylanilytica]|uniref:Chromosome partitioning protein n=1 Tax=Cellulomonas xylanilytica TaxID=233583 RepID=A0A510V6L3_9CELL|nr:chromosome partitioning protein [Cellulomonas xylanilytica]GEK22489.1 chromosome partitioning protein [Cellulomonas xylanilytica]
MSDHGDGSDGTSTSTTTTRLPDIRAEVRDDGTGEISIDGVIERVRMANLAEAGAAITTRIAELAGTVGQPVPVEVRDPDGVWSLLIHPDGLVDEAPGPLDDQPADGAPGDAAPDVEPVVGTPDADAKPGASAARAASGTPSTDRPTPPATGSLTAPPSPAAADPGPASPSPSATAPVTGTSSGPASGSTPAATRGPSATRATTGRPQENASAVAPDTETPGGPPGAAPSGPSQPLPTLDDLLAARHPAASGGPAEHGWQAGIRRLTFGAVSPGPGRDERRRRIAAASVRRTLDGPKTIVIINPKGGAHKTTATMLLAATFGLQRGGYTLAWDNNETRGTLGWRSSHADHTRTAVDLLNALPALGSAGTVRIGDLDGFVRTQPSEQFDVLASDENSASASSVDADSFTSLHQVLSRFYRVLVIDTGNNMRASNWQAAVSAADQIVVVSTVREDTAQSAAWALDALRATGHDEAVRRAVTVLSAPEPKVDKDLQKRLRSHFGALTRAVLDVPHDKALVAGGPIDYDALSTTTRDAWLRVTAVVADGL